MYFIFWGFIILMTVLAVVALLWGFNKRFGIPAYFKIVAIIIFPLVTIGLYWKLGDSQGLIHYWALNQQAKRVNAELAAIKHPEQIVAYLKSYLLQHPNHPKGWYLLGKVYYKQKLFKQAVIALRKAYQQSPNNLDYAVAYAEADFFYRDRHLTPEIKKTLHNVIEHDKNNVGALNLLAIDNYLQGHYQAAIHYWEYLLPLFSVKSKDHAFLLSMIATAQKKRAQVLRKQ